jgi:hypothetical protein
VANLTSSVPGAFDAFYKLLAAAGAAQSPSVAVIAQALQQYEPGSYVCLGETPSGRRPIESYQMRPAALGSYAMTETYEFWGYATVLQGDVDPETVLSRTFGVFEGVVMQTVVSYDGGHGSIGGYGSQILGPNAPTSLQQIVPLDGAYTGTPGSFGGGSGGFQGVWEFGFELMARVSVQ